MTLRLLHHRRIFCDNKPLNCATTDRKRAFFLVRLETFAPSLNFAEVAIFCPLRSNNFASVLVLAAKSHSARTLCLSTSNPYLYLVPLSKNTISKNEPLYFVASESLKGSAFMGSAA